MYTNDPGRKRARLVVSGEVRQFAQIAPNRVSLKGRAGEPLTVRVFINQTPAYPFTITGVRSMYGRDIRYRLEEIPDRDPREYMLVVENVRMVPGKFSDMLYLDTDHPKRPVLQVPVAGTLSFKPVFDGTQGTPAQ